MKKDNISISSAEKTLELIELLAKNNGKLTVSDISKKMNIHVSSADRYILTLRSMGFVEKDACTGLFRLNEKIIALSDQVIYSHPLTKKYISTMHTLSYVYDTTVHIVAFHNGEMITLHKDLRTQNQSFNDAFYDPTRYHYCSGPGKLLLSTLSNQELDAYLERTKIIIFTKNTLSTPEAIRKEIQLIRERGYSYHDEEWLPGNLTLSFPLKVNGITCGAMSLMCNIERKEEMLSPDTINRIRKMLLEPD